MRLSPVLVLLTSAAFGQTRGVSVVPEIGAAPTGIPSISASPAALTAPSLSLPAASLSLTPVPALAPAVIPAAAKAVPARAEAIPAALIPAKAVPAAAAPEKEDAPVEGAKAKADAQFDGKLNVLIAGSEAVPFIKTGGLADVVDAVSRGLSDRGHDVTVVLPKYKALKTQGMDLREAGAVSVPIGGRVETAKLLVGERAGVRVVLIEHPEFYEREGGPYAAKHAALGLSAYDAAGIDDADERFGFYSRATLEAVKVLGIKPDIVHAHDWHAALVPTLLKTVYAADPFFSGAKSALTIHNMAFQGAFDLAIAGKLGIPEEALNHFGGANYLKSGVVHADAVTTVSPNYAKEIVENVLFGMGLGEHLNARPDGVHGIINGIDPELYDPATDPLLERNYGIADAAEGKAANKDALQAKLGLDREEKSPLFVVASRLADQKGIDMVFETAAEIVRLGGQLAIMGTGDAKTELLRAELVSRFPGRIAAHPFDEHAVRLLFAAADFLLMPSRFEPCGLSQLIAQRYGALPIVTTVGGLADTVLDLRIDPINGTGLVVPAVSSISLARAIADAIKGYSHPEAFSLARNAAMRKDNSWGAPLDSYEALYRRLLRSEGPEKR